MQTEITLNEFLESYPQLADEVSSVNTIAGKNKILRKKGITDIKITPNKTISFDEYNQYRNDYPQLNLPELEQEYTDEDRSKVNEILKSNKLPLLTSFEPTVVDFTTDMSDWDKKHREEWVNNLEEKLYDSPEMMKLVRAYANGENISEKDIALAYQNGKVNPNLVKIKTQPSDDAFTLIDGIPKWEYWKKYEPLQYYKLRKQYGLKPSDGDDFLESETQRQINIDEYNKSFLGTLDKIPGVGALVEALGPAARMDAGRKGENIETSDNIADAVNIATSIPLSELKLGKLGAKLPNGLLKVLTTLKDISQYGDKYGTVGRVLNSSLKEAGNTALYDIATDQSDPSNILFTGIGAGALGGMGAYYRPSTFEKTTGRVSSDIANIIGNVDDKNLRKIEKEYENLLAMVKNGTISEEELSQIMQKYPSLMTANKGFEGVNTGKTNKEVMSDEGIFNQNGESVVQDRVKSHSTVTPEEAKWISEQTGGKKITPLNEWFNDETGKWETIKPSPSFTHEVVYDFSSANDALRQANNLKSNKVKNTINLGNANIDIAQNPFKKGTPEYETFEALKSKYVTEYNRRMISNNPALQKAAFDYVLPLFTDVGTAFSALTYRNNRNTNKYDLETKNGQITNDPTNEETRKLLAQEYMKYLLNNENYNKYFGNNE